MPHSPEHLGPISPGPFVDPNLPLPKLPHHHHEPKSDDWRFPEIKCRMRGNEKNGWDENVNY